MRSSIGAAGFCVAYSISGPIGIMDPAFTYKGMIFIGTGTSIVWPPFSNAPVQKSYHLAAAGKYTFLVFSAGGFLPVYNCSVTGFTKNAGPNIYWSGMLYTLGSLRKSKVRARMIV